MQTIELQLREFIEDNFLFDQGTDRLSGHDSLLEQGIIDSAGVLEMLAFLEERYAITIADSELVPQNLDSIDNLVRFIERKQDEVGQPV